MAVTVSAAVPASLPIAVAVDFPEVVVSSLGSVVLSLPVSHVVPPSVLFLTVSAFPAVCGNASAPWLVTDPACVTSAVASPVSPSAAAPHVHAVLEALAPSTQYVVTVWAAQPNGSTTGFTLTGAALAPHAVLHLTTPPVGAPSVPSCMAVASTSSSTVALQWCAPADAGDGSAVIAQYRVRWTALHEPGATVTAEVLAVARAVATAAAAACSPSLSSLAVSGVTLTAALPSLAARTSYAVFVSAVNRAGLESGPSPLVLVTTGAGTAPSAPRAVSAGPLAGMVSVSLPVDHGGLTLDSVEVLLVPVSAPGNVSVSLRVAALASIPDPLTIEVPGTMAGVLYRWAARWVNSAGSSAGCGFAFLWFACVFLQTDQTKLQGNSTLLVYLNSSCPFHSSCSRFHSRSYVVCLFVLFILFYSLLLPSTRESSLGYSSTLLLQYACAPNCTPLSVPRCTNPALFLFAPFPAHGCSATVQLLYTSRLLLARAPGPSLCLGCAPSGKVLCSLVVPSPVLPGTGVYLHSPLSVNVSTVTTRPQPPTGLVPVASTASTATRRHRRRQRSGMGGVHVLGRCGVRQRHSLGA